MSDHELVIALRLNSRVTFRMHETTPPRMRPECDEWLAEDYCMQYNPKIFAGSLDRTFGAA